MTQINFFILHFLVFYIGASIASFIFVYLSRIKNGKNFLTGRSECENCKKKLNVYELIPVVSYIFLRGKCLNCKSTIPVKLFIGEVFLGFWFLASFIFFSNINIFEFFLSCLFGTIFFVLAAEDAEDKEVSAKFMYVLLAIGILNALIRYLFTQNYYDVLLPVLIISPFWIIYSINKKYIGEADPYIFTAIGLFFGSQFSLSIFLYSIYFGAFIGIFYLFFIHKKFERGVAIPFVPIIFLATLFTLLFNYHFIKISDILFVYEILAGIYLN